jgi:ankyrin repeat protein
MKEGGYILKNKGDRMCRAMNILMTTFVIGISMYKPAVNAMESPLDPEDDVVIESLCVGPMFFDREIADWPHAATYILANPAYTRATDVYENNPLHYVVRYGTEPAVQATRLLLKHSDQSSVNKQNKWGNTPLHFLAYSATLAGNQKNKGAEEYYVQIAQLLLQHNAHIDIKNNNEDKPFHIANRLSRKTVAELLLSATIQNTWGLLNN